MSRWLADHSRVISPLYADHCGVSALWPLYGTVQSMQTPMQCAGVIEVYSKSRSNILARSSMMRPAASSSKFGGIECKITKCQDRYHNVYEIPSSTKKMIGASLSWGIGSKFWRFGIAFGAEDECCGFDPVDQL